ncbi:MAG: acyl-CoA thioesterase [Paramuribaculum sp.]|nr:acyl-CoA thioesterase [Candidatus Amulumruptor sp.]MDE6588079.1 acyl-CoA thioesterase [Paramuribaculum sp.]MDE7152275.1 acyl-CoA thioesterase [Candidatus Amulumruptor sp.]MDE7236695.1 acyl-CoA thioesterase [Paramuribaculum sp.]
MAQPLNSSPAPFSIEMEVRDYEVDSQGIVNNAIYLHYLEHTRHEFCSSAGMSFRELQERGVDPVLRRVEIDYLNPLRLSDRFISSLTLRRDGPRFVFAQNIYRRPDMAHVVRAECTIVCLENGRLTRGDILADAFGDHIAY